MTTKDDIRGWLEEGKEEHTHMLVVCDMLDWEDYPVFTSNVSEAIEKYHHKNMQKIMEIYDLSQDLDEQVSGGRVWNA